MTIALLFMLLLASCGKKEHSDLFDYSKPVDLTRILQVYDWYQGCSDDDREITLTSKIADDMPEDVFLLCEDTSFVLRLPQYVGSQQPFLARAEEFYNSCALSWNVWSNYEVWHRGHSMAMLCGDEDVRHAIRDLSADVIRDAEVREAAQQFKDDLLLLMEEEPDEWAEEATPTDLLYIFIDAIEEKAYHFYDDEEAFVNALDSVMDVAEGMAMDKFQHYLDADEDKQLKVILGELAACRNFDEQCSLWRNWANCEKSVGEDEWIIAVGTQLMDSGRYSPILHLVWITWRALCQVMYFGLSRDSDIPNEYYNEYRKKCYVACLKRIESHPEDVNAMNCAAAIGGRSNMNRFGQSYFGNEAMTEGAMLMPKRYATDEEEGEVEDEEEE